MACGGTYVLEQPNGSLMEYFPRFRSLLQQLIRWGGDRAAPLLSAIDHCMMSSTLSRSNESCISTAQLAYQGKSCIMVDDEVRRRHAEKALGLQQFASYCKARSRKASGQGSYRGPHRQENLPRVHEQRRKALLSRNEIAQINRASCLQSVCIKQQRAFRSKAWLVGSWMGSFALQGKV